MRMVKEMRDSAGPIARTRQTMQPACGSVRTCIPYAGELARHRLITADGLDYIVATTQQSKRTQHYVTGAYPVTRGYLVMLRQPLCEVRTESAEAAHAEHDALVQVLAEAGVSVVRARRILAARRRAERAEALQASSRKNNITAFTGATDSIHSFDLAPVVGLAETFSIEESSAAIN